MRGSDAVDTSLPVAVTSTQSSTNTRDISVVVVVPGLHREDHSGSEHRIGQVGIAYRQPDVVAEEETRLHVRALVFGNRLFCYRLQLSKSDSRSYGGEKS